MCTKDIPGENFVYGQILRNTDGVGKRYEKVSLGMPAIFYLPALKINADEYKEVKSKLHTFLLKEFGGYTAEKGGMAGYWIDGTTIDYTENIKYTVAVGKHKSMDILEEFIASVGDELSEKAIYFETGKDSWLIYPLRQEYQGRQMPKQ